ncbi:MAG TPA: acyl-CoA dehydrogenase family protein [Blastocatellia bacterium]|nr:acyl-CoA dehydrogenase family protein [Blastocatellia bacterium]
MEFELTETQKLFQRSARELFAQECPPPTVRQMIENDAPYSGELWDKLVEQGWTGLIFEEDAGGLGLGMVEMAVAFEEMGRALVPGAFLSTVPLAGALIDGAGNAAAREWHLKNICEGRAKATVALLEDNARWDLDAVNLRATETADGMKLKGKKLFVSDAGAADIIITAARRGSELILAIVARDAAGVGIKHMSAIDATRRLYEVSYADVHIPSGDILAQGHAAESALAHAIDVATLALSAEMVGGMGWVLETSVEYAKTRKQFGKPIGQFQAVQHHCANMLLMTESARSAVYYAAWVMGNDPKHAPLAVSMAKAYASDAYREVGNLGIQVHGGIGFTWDENLHFYYKRAKASELMFGDATYHRERIARLVIDRAEEPVTRATRAGD